MRIFVALVALVASVAGCVVGPRELAEEPSVRVALSWLSCGERAAVLSLTLELDPELRPEHFRATAGPHVHVSAGDVLGLVWALREIASPRYTQQALEGGPGFASRVWSEQGQLLDFPDRGYYSGESVDAERVRGECRALVALVPRLLQLRANELNVLHSDVEDFLTYDQLTAASGRAPVYEPDDPHRTRAAEFSKVVHEELWEPLAAYRLRRSITFFELAFPPRLAELYNISSIDSPDLKLVLRHKFAELFAALPLIQSITVYLADSWSPRSGYSFGELWSTPQELGRLANMLKEAVGDRGLYVSLWVPTDEHATDTWRKVLSATANDVSFSVNMPQGDFQMSYGPNNVLLDDGGASRDLIMLGDVFRQYNGWGQLLALPARQWGYIFSKAFHQGVKAVQAQGAWSPGCCWPDSGPVLHNNTGFHSWVGHWNRYRALSGPLTFTGTAGPSPGPRDPKRGSGLGASANAAVFFGLAWDPFADVSQILEEWRPDGRALLLTEGLWLELLTPLVDEWYITWGTVFNPKLGPSEESKGRGLFELLGTKLDALLASGQRARAIGQRLTQAATGELTDFARRTELYATTITSFREAWLANATRQCSVAASALARLEESLQAWQEWPEEASDWCLTEPSPKLYVYPHFFADADRSAMAWAQRLRESLADCLPTYDQRFEV